jgi:ABC-type transporter Mla subunit MlaD
MTMLSNTANELLQNNQQQVTAAVESAREQADVLIQAASDFAEFTQQQQRVLNETVAREIASLNELTSKTSEELNHATEAMQSAAATLDQNLDGALDRTFSAFDKELADITQHLSGTIAQVRDNTEVVPELLMRAQKQYETTLNTLNAQTSQYIESMKKLNRYIQERMGDMTVAESKAGSKKDETEM